MRAAVVLALAVGCTQSPSQGTLWFADSSGVLHELAIASRGDRVVDGSGMFANLAADAATRQLAYTTADGTATYVARGATITQLMPAGGAPRWQPGGWLAYPTTMNGVIDVAIAHPPDQPHPLGSPGPYAFASDASFVAYVRSSDLFVVAPDGSGKRQVATGVLAGITLSPDGGSVLTTVPPDQLEAIALADGSMRPLGTGAVLGSQSYDTDHLLVGDASGLAVLSVADGSRVYAVMNTAAYVGLPAMFTPSGHVLYGLVVDHSTNDTPIYTTDLYDFDGSTSTPLLSSDGYCAPVRVAHHGKYAAIACTDPAAVHVASLPAATSVALPLDDVLGFEADDAAIVGISGAMPFDVVRVTVDGKHAETLATASSAAYLP